MMPDIAQFAVVVTQAERTLPKIGLLVTNWIRFVVLVFLRSGSRNADHSAHHHLADMERLWRLARQQVEGDLGRWRHVRFPQIAVPVVQLASNVVERDAFGAEILSLQFFGECVQVEIFELFWVLEDLLERTGWIAFAWIVVVLERIDGHLPRPFIGLRMHSGAVQHLDVRVAVVVAELTRVDFDEAGTVDEHDRTDAEDGDQLRATLQDWCLLFLDRAQQTGALSRTEAAHELHHKRDVRKENASVQVDAHLVHTIHELEVERVQQLFVGQVLLQRMVLEAENLFVRCAQLRELDQRI